MDVKSGKHWNEITARNSDWLLQAFDEVVATSKFDEDLKKKMVGLVVKHKLDFWYYFAGRLRDDNGWVREEEKLRLNYVADKRALAPGQLGIPEKKSIDSLIRLSGYELDPAVALRNDYKILLGRYSKFQEFEFGYEYKKDGRIGWWPMSDRVAAAVSNFSKNPRAKLSLCAELAGVGAKKQKKWLFLVAVSKLTGGVLYDNVTKKVISYYLEAFCSRDINQRIVARVKRFDPDMFLYITRRVIAKDGRTTKWLYDLEKYGAVYRQFLQGLIDTEEIDRQKVEVVDAPDMAADEYYADYEGTDNKYYNDNCDQMFEEVEATYFDKVVEPEFKKHEHYYYEFVSTPPYSLFNSAWRELFDLKPGNNLLAPSVKWWKLNKILKEAGARCYDDTVACLEHLGEVRRPIFDAVVDQEFDECPKTRKLFSLLENTIRVLVLEVVRDVLINKLDADIKNRVKIYKEMEKHELGNKINLWRDLFISCSNAVQIEFESFLANKLPVLVKDDTMHKLIDLWAKRWFDRYSCNSTSYTAAVATRVSRNVFKDVASELAPDGKKRTKAVNNYLKNIVAPAELEARDQTLLFLFSFRAALYVNMRMVEFVTEVIIESRLDSYFDINRILNYHLCEVYEKNNGAFF